MDPLLERFNKLFNACRIGRLDVLYFIQGGWYKFDYSMLLKQSLRDTLIMIEDNRFKYDGETI